MMSTVAAILASRVGERSRLLVTRTPSRSRLVCAASAASSVQASSAAARMSPRSGTMWSHSQACSNTAIWSASRQIRWTSG